MGFDGWLVYNENGYLKNKINKTIQELLAVFHLSGFKGRFIHLWWII
jgi:hypothetical protein